MRLKMPQLYLRIGRDRFVPIEQPVPGKDTYAWDDKKKRIVLYQKASA